MIIAGSSTDFFLGYSLLLRPLFLLEFELRFLNLGESMPDFLSSRSMVTYLMFKVGKSSFFSSFEISSFLFGTTVFDLPSTAVFSGTTVSARFYFCFSILISF